MNNIPIILLLLCIPLGYSCRKKDSSNSNLKKKPENTSGQFEEKSGSLIPDHRKPSTSKLVRLEENKNVNDPVQEESYSSYAERLEKYKADIFAVNLGGVANRDREISWTRLNLGSLQKPRQEHYDYAEKLLDKHRSSSQLEKLVFWRLVFLMRYFQGPDSLRRSLGDGPHIGISDKLNETLYSALDADPTTLSLTEAVQRADNILKNAINPLEDDGR